MYLDNFFTSLDLALRLADMGFGIVGTTKSNSQGLPDGYFTERQLISVKNHCSSQQDGEMGIAWFYL